MGMLIRYRYELQDRLAAEKLALYAPSIPVEVVVDLLALNAEVERVEAERVEAERVEAERGEAERVEAERVEAERRSNVPEVKQEPQPQAQPQGVVRRPNPYSAKR